MSGRRKYHRYAVTNANGSLKLGRDVTVWRDLEEEFVAISDDPEATGELLTLERIVSGAVLTIQVSVIDSHPTMVNGSLRHRLRLRSADCE